MARIWYDQNATLLRKYCQWRNEYVSPVAAYYSLVRGAHVDPLYSEPTADLLYGGPVVGSNAQHDEAFEYLGPRDTVVAVIFERATGASSQADEAGVETICDGEGYIARNAWEAVWPDRPPKKGDVMNVANEFWDIVGADQGGHVLDSGTYVEWKLRLRKRDRFLPDRKV